MICIYLSGVKGIGLPKIHWCLITKYILLYKNSKINKLLFIFLSLKLNY
jgi:hypothetical protein